MINSTITSTDVNSPHENNIQDGVGTSDFHAVTRQRYWIDHSAYTSSIAPKAPAAFYCMNTYESPNYASALAQLQMFADMNAQTATSVAKELAQAVLSVAYDLEKGSLSLEAAKQLMRFVECNARTNEWQATNRLLTDLDASQLSSKALTGLVRATARTQRLLPAWRKAYKRAWDAVELQGKNPQAMFIGMERPVEDGVAPTSA